MLFLWQRKQMFPSILDHLILVPWQYRQLTLWRSTTCEIMYADRHPGASHVPPRGQTSPRQARQMGVAASSDRCKTNCGSWWLARRSCRSLAVAEARGRYQGRAHTIHCGRDMWCVLHVTRGLGRRKVRKWLEAPLTAGFQTYVIMYVDERRKME